MVRVIHSTFLVLGFCLVLCNFLFWHYMLTTGGASSPIDAYSYYDSKALT